VLKELINNQNGRLSIADDTFASALLHGTGHGRGRSPKYFGDFALWGKHTSQILFACVKFQKSSKKVNADIR
jgi:hypothetical protein